MMVLIGFPQGIADQTKDPAPLAAARRLTWCNKNGIRVAYRPLPSRSTMVPVANWRPAAYACAAGYR